MLTNQNTKRSRKVPKYARTSRKFRQNILVTLFKAFFTCFVGDLENSHFLRTYQVRRQIRLASSSSFVKKMITVYEKKREKSYLLLVSE